MTDANTLDSVVLHRSVNRDRLMGDKWGQFVYSTDDGYTVHPDVRYRGNWLIEKWGIKIGYVQTLKSVRAFIAQWRATGHD